MLGTIVFTVLLVTFLAALGRGATPRAERLPWTGWGARDLIANVVLGARRLVQLHERDPLNPMHAPDGPGHRSSGEEVSRD